MNEVAVAVPAPAHRNEWTANRQTGVEYRALIIPKEGVQMLLRRRACVPVPETLVSILPLFSFFFFAFKLARYPLSTKRSGRNVQLQSGGPLTR